MGLVQCDRDRTTQELQQEVVFELVGKEIRARPQADCRAGRPIQASNGDTHA